MTDKEMDEAGIHPSEYRFDHNRYLTVAWRGTGLWAVIEAGACLNRDGGWEHEPSPSNRDQAFFDRCRFTLDEALKRALEIK